MRGDRAVLPTGVATERGVHQEFIPTPTGSKPASEVAHDLRAYASAVSDGPVAAKLLAAAAELDARDSVRHDSNDGE